MLEDRRATAEEIFAAGAAFTLLAWAFAYLFVLTQTVDRCVRGRDAARLAQDWARTNALELCIALQHKDGPMGDVRPMSGAARGIAAHEIFRGITYIAVVVSRAVGLTVGLSAPDS